jgi:hypothetical protein
MDDSYGLSNCYKRGYNVQLNWCDEVNSYTIKLYLSGLGKSCFFRQMSSENCMEDPGRFLMKLESA